MIKYTLPLRTLASDSTCQYVLPEVDGYNDFGINWSTSRILKCTEKQNVIIKFFIYFTI